MSLKTTQYIKILRAISKEMTEQFRNEEIPLPHNARLAHANIISAYQLLEEHRKEVEGEKIPTV